MLPGQQRRERQVRLGGFFTGNYDGGPGFLDFRPLVGVGDHSLCPGGCEAEFNGRPRKGCKQWNVDRPASPNGQEHDHQVRRLSHQGGHCVSGTNPEFRKGSRATFGALPELAVGNVLGGEVGFNHGEGNGVGIVAIAEELGRAGVRSAIGGEKGIDGWNRTGHSFSFEQWACEQRHLKTMAPKNNGTQEQRPPQAQWNKPTAMRWPSHAAVPPSAPTGHPFAPGGRIIRRWVAAAMAAVRLSTPSLP